MRSSWIARVGLGLLAVACATAGLSGRAAPDRYGIRPVPFGIGTTTVAVLLSDPAARAVVERHAPALIAAPAAPQGRTMTLADIQPFMPDVLTPDVLAAIDAQLAALPPPPAAIAQAHEAIAAIDAARLDPAAPWVTDPAAYAADFMRQPVALQFRRTLTLATRPATLPVRVSADNRFILYVNGERVAAGPARGDLAHYRYERIDLAPWLKAGTNLIAAQVWSDGTVAPVAEISAGHTGLMVKAERASDGAIDTGPAWQVRLDRLREASSGPRQVIAQVGPTYYAAGAPEHHRAALQLPDWNSAPGAGGDWHAAVPAITPGDRTRTMVVDALPPMRYDAPVAGRAVRTTGIAAGGFPAAPVTIPANHQATILIDLGRVMAGYPQLATGGGSGAEVTLTYAEALYDPAATGERGAAVRFADRARVDDGRVLGLTDAFDPDGRVDARFEPFWWRAGRFVELRVRTGAAPLTLRSFGLRETGYPFEQRARFDSDDPGLNAIWRTGWHTARFDAHETYMDTAYWEQLQYIGDTRIQALVSYDVTGDPRLARQALDAFDASRVVDGLPQSSWPISTANPIPPFALLWVGMLHDYWMRQPDTAVLRRDLAGMRSVLDWYAPYARADGMVKATPGWLFVDWRPRLDGGRDRSGNAPDSCIIALLRLGALREAADLERAIGDPERADANDAASAVARTGIQARCWVPERGLYADTPEHTGFSQHANALAVLYDVAPAAERRAILDRVTVPGHGIDAPAGITGTTFYFSFYLARALDHAGMADRYVGLLATWRGLLGQHFTTWPENPDPTRSDSHAWSAHPTSGLLTYVAGIQPAAPGFARVRIVPHLGTLKRLDAAMAHPAGLIETRYRVAGGRTVAEITLPAGLSGMVVLDGRERLLAPGRNAIGRWRRSARRGRERHEPHPAARAGCPREIATTARTHAAGMSGLRCTPILAGLASHIGVGPIVSGSVALASGKEA